MEPVIPVGLMGGSGSNHFNHVQSSTLRGRGKERTAGGYAAGGAGWTEGRVEGAVLGNSESEGHGGGGISGAAWIGGKVCVEVFRGDGRGVVGGDGVGGDQGQGFDSVDDGEAGVPAGANDPCAGACAGDRKSVV